MESVHRGRMRDGIRLLGYGPATEDVAIIGDRIRDVPPDAIQLRQFTLHHPHATMTRTTIRGDAVADVGRSRVSFVGRDVPPTELVDADNDRH